MSLLALIVLLLFSLFFGYASVLEEGSSESQSCASAADGRQRCGPTLIDEEYQVPDSGLVIDAVVDAGPLPPEYQEGYETTIDASGQAIHVNTPLGAADDLGDQRTAEKTTITVELGEEGLQEVLHDLENTGFFYLPTADEIEDEPIGGPASNITVTLEDDTWEVRGAGLSEEDQETLERAQQVITDAVFAANGGEPEAPGTPVVPDEAATPPAA